MEAGLWRQWRWMSRVCVRASLDTVFPAKNMAKNLCNLWLFQSWWQAGGTLESGVSNMSPCLDHQFKANSIDNKSSARFCQWMLLVLASVVSLSSFFYSICLSNLVKMLSGTRKRWTVWWNTFVITHLRQVMEATSKKLPTGLLPLT